MNSPSPELIRDIVITAEGLLSQRFGGNQSLTEVKELSGSGNAVVLRAKVAPSPFLQQRSVVLKYVPGAGNIGDEANLIREIVAYQFTTSLQEDVRPGPVLLTHDVEKKLLVITDAGDGDTFAELLMRSSQSNRIEILRALGKAIGKMHASTAAKEQDFKILLGRMLAKHPRIKEVHRVREQMPVAAITIGERLVRAAGIEIPDEVINFATEAARRLSSGHHRAFTPFDLTPENVIVSDRTHFLDYEWAGFRDAAFDVACVVAGFPQNLSTRPISDEEADVFIDSWVREVNTMWPNVNNRERLNARIVAAMIGWSFSSVALMHFDINDPEILEMILPNGKAIDVNEEMIAQLVESASPWAIDLLSGTPVEPEDDMRLIRLDLYETFEALERFAARGNNPSFGPIAAFAREVVSRLTVQER
ncbi:MAG: phosphotransferase [Corynebacterium sp.]|uniref:phosphotransferase n=1 Tax=Corynebacterium sp. TaxID=1720 RepID=UPI0026DAEF44|nr:phosphotransferase [Corynebacterium sp.]MDO5097803.1 phosphotransferase [Corynebacterium sp.]